MADRCMLNFEIERPYCVVAVLTAVLLGVAILPGMTSRFFLGPEGAVQNARAAAHTTFPEAVKTALVERGLSPHDQKEVEEYLRDGSAYQSMPAGVFLGEWTVGVHRDDVIPVSVFYYEDRPNGLSSWMPYGYGLACVEYRVGEEWEVMDVPCGWEAMMELRAWNSGIPK